MYFTLVENSINDTVIWKPSIYKINYPNSILIISHLNYLKDKFQNKKFYARKNMVGITDSKEFNLPYYGHLVNSLNGEKINIQEKSLWDFTDISIVNIYSSSFKTPMIILSNQEKTIELPVFFLMEGTKHSSRPSIQTDFMISNDFDLLVNKYSNENADAILTNSVKLGMTEEMCILSWGKPDKINKSISQNDYTEQWVYGDSYLYFAKGILKSIQN